MTEKGEGQPRTVKGFVILAGEDSYLAKDRFWFPHDKPEEAFVFPESSVINTVEASDKWDLKPTHVIPAEYTGDEVKVTGAKMSIQEFLSNIKKKKS